MPIPDESLSDKAISTLALMRDIDNEIKGINDFGEASGLCDDEAQLINDFHAQLGSIRARASRLKQRIILTKRNNPIKQF